MADNPPQPQRWQRLRTEPLATTRIFDVTRAVYRHPQRDKERDFFVINAPDWVNVVALTPEHHLVLVRQFRFGTDDFSLEIPGGVIEPGEDVVAAGLRELQEETGLIVPTVSHASPHTYCYDFPPEFVARHHPFNDGQTLCFVVTHVAPDAKVIVDQQEIDAFAWVFPEQIRTYITREKYLEVIEKVLFEVKS